MDAWLLKNKKSPNNYPFNKSQSDKDSISNHSCNEPNSANSCRVGLQLQCSDERLKIKFIAIKSILEVQRRLVEEGHSCKTTHFTQTLAQISSIVTKSAMYLALSDALDSPIPVPPSAQFDAVVFEGSVTEEKILENQDGPKKRRVR